MKKYSLDISVGSIGSIDAINEPINIPETEENNYSLLYILYCIYVYIFEKKKCQFYQYIYIYRYKVV